MHGNMNVKLPYNMPYIPTQAIYLIQISIYLVETCSWLEIWITYIGCVFISYMSWIE